MSLALRDVALGLVELAFPESRPVVRGGGYREAVGGQEGGQGGEEAEQEVAVWSHLFRAVATVLSRRTLDPPTSSRYRLTGRR